MAKTGGQGLRPHAPSFLFAVISLTLLALLIASVIASGLYDVAADRPHTPPVLWTLARLRNQSIRFHARGILIPTNLKDPTRIATGAGLYSEMCSGCHLSPGASPTEISQGLYPVAPQLSRAAGLSPAEEFWVIKHGVKLSAMPAWGKTHSDDLIWDMVAFLQVLPKLSHATYDAEVKAAPADHDALMRDMNAPE